MQISTSEMLLPLWVQADVSRHDAVIYTKHGCGACHAAIQILGDSGIVFKTHELGTHEKQVLVTHTRQTTYPYVFLHGGFIGGTDDLKKHLETPIGQASVVHATGRLVRTVSTPNDGKVVVQYLDDGSQAVMHPALLVGSFSTPFVVQ